MNTRLMVYVRVKPLADQRSIIDIVDDSTLVFDPLDTENQPSNEYFYHGKKFKSIGSKRNKNCKYNFDKVFDSCSTNYHIYETITKPMVDETINGLNCSVFAYGATGSGKTHTMLGTPSCPGVIYYTSKDLFGKLATISATDPLPADLKICYFEIYNEKVRDLLVFEPNNFIRCGNKRLRTTPERCRARQQLVPRDNCNLPVCEGSGDGASLVIPDLSYHYPSNAEQLIELLEVGNTNRSQHPTDANADSSRSHAIFQILLTRRTRRLTRDEFESEYELQTSKMSLIDLAGSERASVAYRAGNDRSKNLQREGGNINKSLLALGNCINALADPKRGHRHIPYRNSKLTRLLRDSLGGKCRTAMIATVCQQSSHYDDTQNTLVYASRAKCIKLKPGRNFTDVAVQPKNYNLIIDNQNKQILALQSQNDELKIELEDIKNEMNTLLARSNQNQLQQKFEPRPTFVARPRSNFFEESRFRSELEELYDKRCKIRLDIRRYESKFKINELKLAFKRLDEARQQVIQGDLPRMNGNTTVLIAPGVTTTLNNIDQSQALKTQLSFFEQERKTLLDTLQMNEIHIREVISSMNAEFEMEGYGSSEEFDSIIEPYLNDRELQLELEEKKVCEQHAYDIAQQSIDRLMATEDLLLESAHNNRYVYAINKGRGLSDSLDNKLSQFFKKFEGKKNVVWKDHKYEMENDQDNSKPVSKLLSVHDNFSLNFITPFKNNNTLHSRRLSKNLVSLTNYTPEQSNTTFDASK